MNWTLEVFGRGTVVHEIGFEASVRKGKSWILLVAIYWQSSWSFQCSHIFSWRWYKELAVCSSSLSGRLFVGMKTNVWCCNQAWIKDVVRVIGFVVWEKINSFICLSVSNFSLIPYEVFSFWRLRCFPGKQKVSLPPWFWERSQTYSWQYKAWKSPFWWPNCRCIIPWMGNGSGLVKGISFTW